MAWQVIAIAHVAVGELDDSQPRPGGTRAGGGDTACAGVLDVSPSVHALADGLVALASSAREKMAGNSVGGPSSGDAAGEGRAPAVWVGVAGAPGSGKSTLTHEVTAELARRGVEAVTIPMDGFHYPRAFLDTMPEPEQAHARRGAPFTFDAEGLVATLARLKRDGAGTVPSFDHAVGDPVPDGVELKETAEVVLVEGNYLLMWDTEPWRKLRPLFDTTWFLHCPEAILRERVIERNAAAWQWDVARTAARVDANDMRNARLVQATQRFADLTITTHRGTPVAAGAQTEKEDDPHVPEVSPDVVSGAQVTAVEGMRQALFIQTGFGACQKGVGEPGAATKAAVRAVHDAIAFNSVPAIRVLCSGRGGGGAGGMVVRVTVAVPAVAAAAGQGAEGVDADAVRRALPHGDVSVDVQEGGGRFCSGVRVVDGAEVRDEMLVAVAHVVVGRR